MEEKESNNESLVKLGETEPKKKNLIQDLIGEEC